MRLNGSEFSTLANNSLTRSIPFGANNEFTLSHDGGFVLDSVQVPARCQVGYDFNNGISCELTPVDPQLSLTAEATLIATGASTTLNWSYETVPDNCQLLGPDLLVSDAVAVQSVSTGPLQSKSTYELTCDLLGFDYSVAEEVEVVGAVEEI